MWQFRHQPGINVMLVDYQLGIVNKKVFSRQFSVKPVQASKQVLCLKIFSISLDSKSSAPCAVLSILNIHQWFILFPWGKSILPEFLTGEPEKCKIVGKSFSFYCVVSLLHLESTKSLFVTNLSLIGLWEIFEHLLHGCISASMKKGLLWHG